MSFLFRNQSRALGDTPNNLIPPRSGSTYAGGVYVNATSAMKHSAVWACLRLRADLVSTLPLNVYRNRPDGTTVQIPTPPVLQMPGGERVGIEEWLYSSQIDLDRCGNAFGLITARDGLGLPRQIELQDFSTVTVSMRSNVLTYKIGTSVYQPQDVWHERQFTTSGGLVGMSPIAMGAVAIGQYLSAQAYALDWYANGAIPTGKLKNTAKTISATEASVVKDRFKAAVSGRDLFVTGSDWDYSPIQAVAGDAAFIDAMKFSLSDVCRFFGVPADLVDAEQSGQSITYANVTQRNLQFLLMNLQPALTRRENTFSRQLVAAPRFIKFSTDQLLRMDPASRAAMLGGMVNSRLLAPSEARAMDNREAFTEDQYAEFDRLFTKRTLAIKDAAEIPENSETT